MSFGEYLKKTRIEKGFSIRQLGAASGVSNAYLSQVERGERGTPAPDILRKLYRPLGVSYEEIMWRAGYSNTDKAVGVSGLERSEGAIPTEIATNIVISRRKANMGQRELAEAIGVEETIVAFWESGYAWPSRAQLQKLAAILNTTPEAIAPSGVPASFSPDEALKGVEIWLRMDKDLTEQEINEILSYLEWTRARKRRSPKPEKRGPGN